MGETESTIQPSREYGAAARQVMIHEVSLCNARFDRMPKLVIKSGQSAGREFNLGLGIVSIGRNHENTIAVPEASISTFHCELHVAEIGVAVHDLESTNGTYINRQRVAKGMLHSGDVLTLGDIDFDIEVPDVTIALPEMQMAEAPGAAFLDDGTPACFGHREVAALYRCPKCENWWCGECVRQLKRPSGDFLQFCPQCSSACTSLVASAKAKKSFLQRVGDTLRLPRRK
jgi:hypothetical protein